jgi:hypothetical protein
MKNTLPSQLSLFSTPKDSKVIEFLKAVPNLDFSEKGFFNISKRFEISIEHLTFLIELVQRKKLKNKKK